MEELYFWWHDRYTKFEKDELEEQIKIWKEIDKLQKELGYLPLSLPQNEKETRIFELYSELRRIEDELTQELQENLITLVKIRPSLWT